MRKVAGYAKPELIIGKALETAEGDIEKAIEIARSLIVVGGKEGTTEEAFQRLIAEPIRQARRMQ